MSPLAKPRALALGLLLFIPPLLAGCNVIGAGAAVGQKVFGPADVDPVYKLGLNPTLVLVENFRNPVGSMSDAETVTRYIIEDLHENLKPDKKKGPQIVLIDQEKLIELQNSRPSQYAKMRIPEIGKALGAKQVLYVDLQISGVDLTPGSELLRGRFVALVKVVDCATGQNLYPTDVMDGIPVSWESKPQRPTDQVYPAAVRERSLRVGSNHIARMFYKWKPDDAPDDDELQAVPAL